MQRKTFIRTLLATAAAATLPLAAQAAEVVTIGIGTQNTTTNTVTGGIVIKELKLLEKHLPKTGKYKDIRFKLDWQNFTSGPPITNGMMAKKLHIGMMGDYPLLVNGATFQASPETKSRLIALIAGRKVAEGDIDTVLSDPPYYQLSDLKGKKVSVPFGSAAQFVEAFGGSSVTMAFGEVVPALQNKVVDCAITGTASGNSARWYEVARGLYALPVAWSTSGYLVNLAWWNRLDPAVRGFIEAHIREVEEAQWRLGAETTEDGIACNTGARADCRIGRLVEGRTMTVARPSEADIQAVRATLSANVLPGWVRRCGERCGQLYDRLVAPVSGVSR